MRKNIQYAPLSHGRIKGAQQEMKENNKGEPHPDVQIEDDQVLRRKKIQDARYITSKITITNDSKPNPT